MSKWPYDTSGIPDCMFKRGKVPMTKEEVRAITISKLRLRTIDKIVDIGAGTGSISIEAALVANKGKVYAVEKNGEGIELIKENAYIFQANNIEIIEGIAPEVLCQIGKVDKVILGGTGGNIKSIFEWVSHNLKSKGIIVVNAITIENLYKSMELMKEKEFENIEVISVSISKGRPIGNLTMMESQNQIYIISANRK
ncbi:cobalt-precorrin-6B (C15)-methyltransferase [Proteiniborus ethanoligenes]|uniref:Cobalt-precorrin-6B (C15)-methyltransferase n=1 Tax=Proteiniborus ethanoligenes TaxID=415015 RepID=A0A1H3QKM4_9FIRM|nr:precorrin-6Y C5,15-methyltransferase (decarboxylating) subunit CbiT [Proteiniborus ethanoligenes]SDZ13578.1 cobalt-precorrin-6B (C15)-methyltransferase [Proteiniborus ethanoligenes]